MQDARFGPGRPHKYGRAARAVTVTLPEDVLTRLSAVHADLGRAIVSVTERHGNGHRRPIRPAELAAFGKQAVIVVNPARALKRLPGVQLVPLGNGRSLISLDPDYSISQLELDVRDALDHRALTGTERRLLQAIAAILQNARRSPQMTASPRTIIVLERNRLRKNRS